jgi:hypothetical protein
LVLHVYTFVVLPMRVATVVSSAVSAIDVTACPQAAGRAQSV